MKRAFFGGVHPKGYKELSREAAIVPLHPSVVSVAMSQHIGAPCQPLVKVGDRVTVGQKIGDGQGLCVPVHASVSGTVTAIEARPHPGGNLQTAIVIESDGRNTLCPTVKPRDPEAVAAMSAEDLIAVIREAGITGMGGAGFPTSVKLSSGLGKVDTVIVNGAECEPYITADHRLMLERGEAVLGGVSFIMKALGLQTATIGIEGNKLDAVEHLKSLLPAGSGIQIETLKTRYPQGAEKQLIQRVTGREVPPGGLPADVGCTVFNVATASAIYDAVTEGKPLTHRNVTLTGGAMTRPLNVFAPIGTPLEHLVKMAGGFKTPPQRLLMGGPMMGNPQYDLTASMMKGTNCLLALTDEEAAVQDAEQTCIRCGKCVNVCPMHLMPLYMRMYSMKRDWEKVQEYNVMDCMECGSCNYICPARIHLVQTFRMAKFEIRGLQAKQKAKEAAKA